MNGTWFACSQPGFDPQNHISTSSSYSWVQERRVRLSTAMFGPLQNKQKLKQFLQDFAAWTNLHCSSIRIDITMATFFWVSQESLHGTAEGSGMVCVPSNPLSYFSRSIFIYFLHLWTNSRPQIDRWKILDFRFVYKIKSGTRWSMSNVASEENFGNCTHNPQPLHVNGQTLLLYN